MICHKYPLVTISPGDKLEVLKAIPLAISLIPDCSIKYRAAEKITFPKSVNAKINVDERISTPIEIPKLFLD